MRILAVRYVKGMIFVLNPNRIIEFSGELAVFQILV